jgi:tripartite-type tricarboxylate transporter receptor subunit TctC
MKRLLSAALLTAALTTTGAALAWPTKPVRMVVPAPAGSSLDIIVRLLGEKLKDKWGQPMIVENKPGAGGMLGVDVAAKAAPDGHTLTIGFNGPIAFAPFLYKKVPYDPAKDLIPVVMTTSQPNVLAVNAGVPAKDVKELIAWIKANPGKVNYASVGNGSSSHLAMELFLSEAGVKAQHIPFNGSPPAAASVAAGDSHMLFAVASGIMPQVQAGKVKLLAVTTSERFESMKELPTIAESGLPGFNAAAWNGLFTAAGTPADVVDKINRDVAEALAAPDVRQRFSALGMSGVGGTPAQFKAIIDADMKKWGALIERLGVKLD